MGTIVKYIASLMVVVSHLTGFHCISTFLAMECSFGWVAVSLFFFYSGYGLANGFVKKGKLYFTDFLQKRLYKVFIPLLIAYLCFYCADYYFHRTTDVSFWEIVKRFFSDDPYLPYSWFVSWLLVIYLLFYIVGKCSCKSNFLRNFSVVFLVFYVALVFSKLGSWCKVSTHCFLLGVIFRFYEYKIIERILLFCGKILLLVSLGIFTISYNWIRITTLLNCQESIIYSSIPLYVGSLSFIVWFVILSSRCNEMNKYELTNSSYEVYLCQGIVFAIIGRFVSDGIIFYMLSFVGCVFLGYIFKGIIFHLMSKI